MSPFNPLLLIGHAALDRQHAEIVQLITGFRAHIVAGTLDERALRDFLARIHDYAVYHFGTEEKFMRRVKYPNYDRHRDEHLIFWGRLLEMMERCEEGSFGIACGDMIYAVVGGWLKDHIEVEDMALAAWVRVLRGPMGTA